VLALQKVANEGMTSYLGLVGHLPAVRGADGGSPTRESFFLLRNYNRLGIPFSVMFSVVLSSAICVTVAMAVAFKIVFNTTLFQRQSAGNFVV
jgi:hypothetical protein